MRWSGIIKWGRLMLPFIKGVSAVTIVFFLASFAVKGTPFLGVFVPAAPVFAQENLGRMEPGWLNSILLGYKLDYVRVFSQELPLSFRYQPIDSGEGNIFFSWLGTHSFLFKLNPQPLDLIQTEIGWSQVAARSGHRSPVLAKTSPKNQAPAESQAGAGVNKLQPVQPAKKLEGSPRIAIYHTHTSEDYVPTSGRTHTYDQEASIVAVGRRLAQELEEQYDICCLHDTTVHDAEVFREAYLRSADTVTRLLKENPSLDIILDIHRDAPSRDQEKSRSLTTVEVEGNQAGRIYIIVGTDRLGLEHPDWQQNHTFALELQEELERVVPGLSRGIKIDEARFNQHLCPRLLLIEIGGDQNTVVEAELGAKYLAQALNAWFKSRPPS